MKMYGIKYMYEALDFHHHVFIDHYDTTLISNT